METDTTMFFVFTQYYAFLSPIVGGLAMMYDTWQLHCKQWETVQSDKVYDMYFYNTINTFTKVYKVVTRHKQILEVINILTFTWLHP